MLGRSGGLVMEERDASASTGGSDPSGKLRFAVTPEQMGWIERESKARGVDRSDLIREVFARGMGETSSNGSGVAAPPYGGAGSASEAADAPGVVGLPSVHPSPASPPASLPVRSAVVAAEAGGASRAVSDREVLASPPPAPAGVGAAAVAAGGAPGALPDREVSASPPRASAGTGAAAAAAGVVDAADDPSVEAGPPSSFVAVPPEAAARPGAKASAESALAALVASGNSAGLPVIGGLGGPGGIVPGRGLVVLVSDENGQFSPVTVSSDLFRPVPRSVFASFFDAPRAFRWAVAGIVAVSLLFGAAYVSMAVVSSRYQFREVAVSPGAVDLLQGGPLDRPHDPLPDRRRSCRSGLLARIMREGVDSGRDTRASVWYKRSVYKRLATTEAPA